MKQPEPIVTISSRRGRRPLNPLWIALLAVVLVAVAAFAWFLHGKFDDHARYVRSLEAELRDADRTAAAYQHLVDLTEQRRQQTNRSLDDLNRAETKLHDVPAAGYASVISGYLDDGARVTHFDDIQQDAQDHLPADEFRKLNAVLNPLVKRGAEFDDAARAVAATMREFLANPLSLADVSADKLWGPYNTAQQAKHDAFMKYQDLVYSMQGDADSRRDAFRGQWDRARNESFTQVLETPAESHADANTTSSQPTLPEAKPTKYASQPISRSPRPTASPSPIHAAQKTSPTRLAQPPMAAAREDTFPGPGFAIAKCPSDLPESMGSHPVCATKISDPTAGYKVQPGPLSATEPTTPGQSSAHFPGPGFAITTCPPDLPESMGSHPVCAAKISDPTAGYKVRPGS